MENCLEGLRDDIGIPYLDDTIVFSQSFSAYVEGVRTVYRWLRWYGIKLKPSKCELFRLEVLSGEDSKTDPADTIPVRALKEKRPHTVREVRAIMGLLSYYRLYIRVFSCIVGPLCILLKVLSNVRQSEDQEADAKPMRQNVKGFPLTSQSNGPKNINRYWRDLLTVW